MASMPPLTIFLAKLFGLYCVIFGLAMMVRGQTGAGTLA
jgi:hypothetical protein